MYFYILLALVAVIAIIMFRRATTPVVKLKPSDMFPWKGIVTDIIKKTNESKNARSHISNEQVSIVKELYNNLTEKFFKLLNVKTEKLAKFEEGQFEKIVKDISKVLSAELMEQAKLDLKDVKKLTKKNEALQKIGMPLLFGNFIVGGGPMGPNLYATYKKYKEELTPLLSFYYKGPAFPTQPPSEMGMKPIKPPTSKLPSDYFPYIGFVDSHLRSIMIPVKAGSFRSTTLKEKNIFKSYYDIHIKRFFEIMNNETGHLRVFNPNHFEQIFARSFGQINREMANRMVEKGREKETKLMRVIIPPLISKILKDHRIVKGNRGPDFYATFKNQILNLQPFLNVFYKGPPLPTVDPVASAAQAVLKCQKDEKDLQGRCVKIMCPFGSTMTGKHVNGSTECQTINENGKRRSVSSTYIHNSRLPERRSTPDSRPASSPRSSPISRPMSKPISKSVCSKHKKMKNGKCVRVICPLGTTHTGQILNRGNGFMHSCVNNRTKIVELIDNDKLPEATCLRYDSRGKCFQWGIPSL